MVVAMMIQKKSTSPKLKNRPFSDGLFVMMHFPATPSRVLKQPSSFNVSDRRMISTPEGTLHLSVHR